jgi:hypothetical protein
MTIATEIRKLRESRAYYAAAGAGDLAAEKLREVPGQLAKLQQRADAKDIGGAAVAYVAHFGARAVEVFDDLAERGRRVMTDHGPAEVAIEKKTPSTGKATATKTAELDQPTKTTRKPRQTARTSAAAGNGKKSAS